MGAIGKGGFIMGQTFSSETSPDHAGDCACDYDGGVITADQDLPLATGGVTPAAPGPVLDEADGCGIGIGSFVLDEDLPAARGGVA